MILFFKVESSILLISAIVVLKFWLKSKVVKPDMPLVICNCFNSISYNFSNSTQKHLNKITQRKIQQIHIQVQAFLSQGKLHLRSIRIWHSHPKFDSILRRREWASQGQQQAFNNISSLLCRCSQNYSRLVQSMKSLLQTFFCSFFIWYVE